MVTEIAGAKMLTPFFGASLYSWAATLSITLLALMTGYYSGGYVTTRPGFASRDRVVWVFFLSGLAVLMMPGLGSFIMQRTISLSFFSGLIISELFFLFLPVFFMGMISPMVIFQITQKAEQSGRSAGNVYAVSTCGGILFTLVFGFLIIPYYGISTPVRVLGLLVSAIALLVLAKEKLSGKKTPASLLLLVVIAAMAFKPGKPAKNDGQSNMRVVSSSEGLLGELKVIDQLSFPPNAAPVCIRKLRINNVAQNYVFRDLPTQSLLYYVNFTRQLLNSFPKKDSVLLIGLGAGSLYKILSDKYRSVETVELDKRIYEVGVRYFGMAAHKDHVITDGRYFINTTGKKYDLLVLDAIIGENVAAQLTTLESFRRMHAILKNDGMLLVEIGGLASFSENSFVPSVLKTLKAAGFQVSMFNPIKSGSLGDVLFVASKTGFDTRGRYVSTDVQISGGPLAGYQLSAEQFDNRAAVVLTDDRNYSEVLLKSHHLSVRKSIRKELARYNFWE